MFRASLARLCVDESGASAIEYGLIVALVSVVLVAVLSGVGSSLDQTFETAANTLN